MCDDGRSGTPGRLAVSRIVDTSEIDGGLIHVCILGTFQLNRQSCLAAPVGGFYGWSNKGL